MKYFQKLNKLSKSQVTASLFAVIFAGIGVYILAFTHAADLGSLSLSPASSTINAGSNFNVTVVENSGSEPVNAVQANVTYDATKLQFVGLDTPATGTSIFDTDAQHDSSTSGLIKIARGSTTPRTGQQNVAVITFKALAASVNTSASVGFDASSVIVSTSSFTNIVGSNFTGATYTINDTETPTKPTGLSSSGATSTSVTLTWAASTDNVGVTGYNILRNGTKIGTSATTSYTDGSSTPLTPNTQYSYTVQAYDAAGKTSAASNAFSITTGSDTTKPSNVTGVTVSGSTATTVSLTWTAATDNVSVTGYNIYRGGTKVGTSITPTYTDGSTTPLVPNTSYSYTIEAYDGAGNVSAAKSSAVNGTTAADTTAPSVPGGLTLTSKTTNSAKISWTASTDNVGVTGYNILRNGVKINTSTTTSYTDSGLTAGSTYSYTVQAYDAAGKTSASSSPLSVTLPNSSIVGDITSAANGPFAGQPDGVVDIYDLSRLSINYGKGTTGPKNATFSEGDITSIGNGAPDGQIDIYDLSLLSLNWTK